MLLAAINPPNALIAAALMPDTALFDRQHWGRHSKSLELGHGCLSGLSYPSAAGDDGHVDLPACERDVLANIGAGADDLN
jgi:hypothetical protein